MTESVTAHCSFCTKTQDDVRKLIRGGPKGDVYIYDECVDVCSGIVFGEASIVFPLRMTWRALWWRITGRLPSPDSGA